MDTELSKKTTILFPPELHTKLTELASMQRVSMGELVRDACERAYGDAAIARKLAALDRLAALNSPVGTPGELERESVPAPEEICPNPV